MRTKSIFLLLAGACFTGGIAAQATDGVYVGKPGCDLNCQMLHVSNQYSAIFSQHYLDAAVFVWFRVDSSGSVCDIRYMPETPKYLAEFIKDALGTTSGSWKPELKDGRPVTSKPFLLPILCEFLIAPKDSSATEDAVVSGFRGSIYWLGRMALAAPATTVRVGANKWNASGPPVDCLVLPPLQLSWNKFQ